ncbi:hypothetical protein [Amycolatopsis sp. Hca4]|uniref:hypothetical protein n=1 Tax=Amycolatopsis sp. Hca4 TaxID=2742131 RepID=UPI0015909BEA|nr:hypothetical protein [Amycolatopsis sp. Hca4]QKV80683.1 hypothetical protein HUT10_48080 [Amycolatopsis sp. Hca4]
MTPPAKPYRRWARLGVAAAVACGVCCALPLITLLGGIGVVSSLGAIFKVFELASIVLAVLAFSGAAVLWVRRLHRTACRVPGRAVERVVDLGMPDPTQRGPR